MNNRKLKYTDENSYKTQAKEERVSKEATCKSDNCVRKGRASITCGRADTREPPRGQEGPGASGKYSPAVGATV